MKKLILVGLMIQLWGLSMAQSVKFGLKAGVNLSGLLSSGQVITSSSRNLTGYHAGGYAEVSFGSIMLQPGIAYVEKGGKYDDPLHGGPYLKTQLNYLEVPINVIYKIPLRVGKVFFGAGPYVAYALSGTQTLYNVLFAPGSSSGNLITDVKFGSATNDNYKNSDYGLNFLAGFRLNKGLELSAGYELGLANLSNYRDLVTNNIVGNQKSRTFSLSLGYFFL